MNLAKLNPFSGLKPWGQFNAPKIVQGKAPLTEQAPAYGYTSLVGMLAPVHLPGDLPPGSQGFTTYRRMQNDPQIKACLSTKKFAVLSRGWEVHPADQSPEALAVAEFVRWTLADMRGSILDVLYAVMDALALGVSIVEINYKLLDSGPYAGKFGLASLKSKNPEIFFFDVDSFMNLHALRIAGGLLLDPQKFLIYSYQPQYENPLGSSDLRAAYRSWFIKEQLLAWWAKFLEKFGLPTVVGDYDPKAGYGGPAAAAICSTVMRRCTTRARSCIPADMEIKLLEAQRALDAGFDEAVAYCDRAIAKSILGETLTADSSSPRRDLRAGPGPYGRAFVLSPKIAARFGRNGDNGAAHPAADRATTSRPELPARPSPLGKIDDGKLQTATALISALVAGNVIAPNETWIREYLGIPAAEQDGLN